MTQALPSYGSATVLVPEVQAHSLLAGTRVRFPALSLLSKYSPLSLCSVVLETSSQSNSGEITRWEGRKKQNQDGEAKRGARGINQTKAERANHRTPPNALQAEGRGESQSVSYRVQNFHYGSPRLNTMALQTLCFRGDSPKAEGERRTNPPTDLSPLSLLHQTARQVSHVELRNLWWKQRELT